MRWPKGFMNISDCTFRWVYQNKKEFVNFTLEKMDSPTGLFKLWKTYCLKQKDYGFKEDSGQRREVQATEEISEPIGQGTADYKK